MRYALYFSPAPESHWWQAGADWLGRDPLHTGPHLQTRISGVPDLLLAELTRDARRYGFHATLKAPFELREGFHACDLEAMASAFSAIQHAFPVGPLSVRRMGQFLALLPAEDKHLRALAMRCVSYFDLLRAAPDQQSLNRRRRAGLSARQEELLLQWGYPYTEEEYHFHLTLTDAMTDSNASPDLQYAIRKAAEQHFQHAAQIAPLLIDGLTIFREEHPGADFQFWRRFPFQAAFQQKSLPDGGRLFYVVGPSGAGKDSLLQWVRARLPADRRIHFAQRVITRPCHDSEDHFPVTQEQFWQQASAGEFCMHWQANQLHYGIRRHIEAHLRCGQDVVVNGSREYVPQLRLRFPEAQIIWIEADATLIQERIARRQRETGAALLHRVQRAQQFTADNDNIHKIDNSGTIDIAGQQLLQLLMTPASSQISSMPAE
ncbi:phosphonate metabolism protein/1,5-bisphosphokinase (PRPP-forming) PhnN [Undibacterium sp. SXout7W]|uniref:phosphonate metabolism protein/1,5-bisphosphokinase (PRPP-forming) PhnN n=1 Tax=Undibacterium sp. SXout7W TaxID=3413049 RepID=UPI003BF3DBE2